MNFFTTNKQVLEAMSTIFDQKFASNSKVNFAVSYSENRKMTMVVVQVVRAGFYHGLILVFTNSLTLYSVIKFNKNYIRNYGIFSKHSPPVDIIRKFIFRNIPPYNPLPVRKLKEGDGDETDLKIEKLKNQIGQLKNSSRGYRDEINNLRKRIRLMKKQH